MEAIVQPRRWEDFPNGRDALFRALRSEQGERLVLDENFFVEVVLPKSIIRKLSDQEMQACRAPFPDRKFRLPTLLWLRALLIDGAPADVVKIVIGYGEWLAASNLPKLFINADLGAQVVERIRDFCRIWPNQQEITVPGIHFIQEDSPDQIGAAVQEFVGGLRRRVRAPESVNGGGAVCRVCSSSIRFPTGPQFARQLSRFCVLE